MYHVGQDVRSTKDSGSTDWSDNEHARNRPWGVTGKVVRITDGHGLVYLVEMGEALEWYEEVELEAVKTETTHSHGRLIAGTAYIGSKIVK